MADEIIFDDGEGNLGVGTLNTGDSGINDGNSSPSTGNQGGGAAGPTNTSSGNSGPSVASGVIETSTENKEAEINSILNKWLALSAISIAFDDVIKAYVENKLGFGPEGTTLKKKYKEDNPEMDPDAVDAAVDKQYKATLKLFKGEEGENPSSDELKKKFEEFKNASFEVQKNLKSVISDLAKVTAEAFMPPVVGPVAPNPLTTGLKLVNGVTRVKAVIDRAVISMKVFMVAAKAIGVNNTDVYKVFINTVYSVLNPTLKALSNSESEAAAAADPDLAEFTLKAKKSYSGTGLSGATINYKEVESMARDEFEIYVYPLDDKDLRKLFNILSVNPGWAAIPGIGFIAAVVDLSTTTDKERRAEIVLDYNNHLVTTINEFIEERDKSLERQNKSGSTNSNATDAGGSNKGPGGDVYIGTK